MESIEESFDFVVVGAGTAGCILAHRLATAASRPSVLLLEVGGPVDDELHLPIFQRFTNIFTRPDLDHGYSTTPQTAVDGRVIPYARGKGVGGSSLLNFMVYTRGAAAEYDRWAEIVGSEDWAWKNVEKSFKQVERYSGQVPKEVSKWAKPNLESYGTDGFVGISLPQRWEKEMEINFRALEEMGYPPNLDPNAGDPMGSSICATTMEGGRRSTGGSSLLRGGKPSNLTIWTEARATKIRFSGNRAVGVDLHDGRYASASKEVIITAGSIDTPKLLLLSGIGPASELSEHKIDIVHDLPGVGKNLQDHSLYLMFSTGTPDYSDRGPFLLSPEQQALATEEWNKSKTGLMTDTFGSLGHVFIKIPELENSIEFKALPQAEQDFLQQPTTAHVEIVFAAPVVAPDYTPTDPNVSHLSNIVVPLNQQSRGSVTLSSSDPSSPPLIDFAYLSHPFDKVCAIAGLKKGVAILKTKTISPYVTAGVNVPKSESDEDCWEFLKASLTPVWHASGSVMMGREGEEGKCVDKDLRVFGVQRLRVADLSVCPRMLNAHTQAAAYLIGQVAGEKIVEEYGL